MALDALAPQVGTEEREADVKLPGDLVHCHTMTRGAASSIANGKPSNRLQQVDHTGASR
jgi:hypothetical protein